MPEEAKLAGKVALVTGGAKRLGREIALELARNGAAVALTYRTSERAANETAEEVRAMGVAAKVIHCDLRKVESIKQAVGDFQARFDRLDVLVNNAGVFSTAEFSELTLEQWDDAFSTNVRGPFLLSQAAAPLLRRSCGRIINLGSLGGERPWATHAHYCASKAALHMLTRCMAKALAPEIAVNCVAPGMIDLGEVKRTETFARFAAKTPTGRNGTASDVVAAVLFFSTSADFITGQVLTVDGGLGL